MGTTQTAITREVYAFMGVEHMTQAKLAAYLGMAQGRVSDRLRGKREWTPSDMDRLIALGVPLRLPEPVGGEQR